MHVARFCVLCDRSAIVIEKMSHASQMHIAPLLQDQVTAEIILLKDN
jgi:hypothetical protein